ncbi:2-oxoglutarate and iron-dependent oxygenase domain-containing protein [Nonomuraea sp. NPDC050790]|uniref:2-oxoglutarate and iron-dependent oxygenase domain-containing protein n=1 Tax=Nonomuraea sp. NPDC050790 TaxID=3364371 RepID=UPI00379C5783
MFDLTTFALPETVTGSRADRELGRGMVSAWRRDGIFQVAATAHQHATALAAFEASREFFALPPAEKSSYVTDLSYSGYVASGEEVTAGATDYAEIFTVCPDVPVHDDRVRGRWPCHGPVPWPGPAYQRRMEALTAVLGSIGERLLRLAALGLGMGGPGALTAYTEGGWHHLRVLRFPPRTGHHARGIGAHTDYGMLVIAAQDEVGGLYVRPPVEGEKRPRNWLEAESTAGMYGNEPPWTFVRPVPRVFTVFPGDILQFLTGGFVLSTPHKVELAERERFAMAYFHEPGFGRALEDPCGGPPLHYGTHFTNMFMRCYPERAATLRIRQEGRLERLREPYPH